MAELGCDIEEMARLEQCFARQADAFSGVITRVDLALSSLVWDGQDAGVFKNAWRTRGRVALSDASVFLRDSAHTVQRNRLEQVAASNGAGTATAGAAAAPGPGNPYPGSDSEPPGGWAQQAADRAGIDLSTWRPELGANANAATIEAVYRYYGQLYLDHPELQWAGMANMIGPSFAAGFFDLAAIREEAARLTGAIDQIPAPFRPPELDGLRSLSALSDADLHFYETTFLDMQRKIFLDQAAMHEAYLSGGIPALEQMQAAGRIDDNTLNAWRMIDEGSRTGNQALITAGNTGLLRREQRDIIARDYQTMYDHQPTGPAMTYMMTLIGTPSIPGAHSFGEVFPLTVSVETPGPEQIGTPDHIGTPDNVFGIPVPNIGVDIPSVSVDDPLQGTVTVITPFPNGNIANFDDRWNLITTDTLPAYQALLNDPGAVQAIVSSDIVDRIDANRLSERVDDIVADLLDWNIEFSQ